MERTMMDMIDLSDKQEKAVALAVCGKRDGEIAALTEALTEMGRGS